MMHTNLGLKLDYVNILAMNDGFYINDYFYILSHLTLNVIFYLFILVAPLPSSLPVIVLCIW